MKQIRVALSGSGFRFPAHVGALSAIDDMGYEVIELAGTSGGSIVGSMYCAGKTSAELKDIMFTTDFKPMLSFNLCALHSFSYCDGEAFTSFVQSVIGADTTFGDLKIPLRVAASDIRADAHFIFDAPDQNVSLAVKASAAVPFLFSPVIMGDKYLIDGGACYDTPIDLLKDDSVLKLGIKLTSKPDTAPVKGMLSIFLRTLNTIYDQADAEHINFGKLEGAIFSFVDTGTVGSFNNDLTQEERQQLFDSGYSTTKQVLMLHEQESLKKGKIDYVKLNHKIYTAQK